jgi:type I restriction enzyme S subunit
MSSEWPVVRLGDHVDSCLGKMLDAKKNKGIAQRYLGNSNVRWGSFDISDLAEMRFEPHEEERYGLLPGDLIVCEGGEPGRCAIWTGEAGMKIQKALHRIRPKSTFNNYYLYYWMCHAANRGSLEQHFTGTTIKHLTGRAIAALEVRCPPIEVQLAMVDVLKTLDDRITLLRETNTTLEAIAQALFKSWFVDFDPVHAKMQGLAPEGMDEATAALFPDSFEESELGPLPKGWRVGIISDLGEVICGKTPPTSNPENYGDVVPFITIPDMHNRLVITNTGRSLSITGANSQKKKNLPAGSICVSCIATPGLVVRVTRESQTNQQINSVVPLSIWGKSFPLFLLRRIGDAVRAAGSGGSVFHNLSKSGFEAISVLLTSYELAQKFEEMVEPLIARIEANQQQQENLAATRDALLPRLISGQMQLDSMEAVDGC